MTAYAAAMPIHLRAQPGDVAPMVFLVGDPGRAERIAATLHDPQCYNRNRGLLGFTGAHDGIPLSVQTTGIGGPSAAIVVEELADLGVETVVRLGTCGAIGANVSVLDLVISTAAVPLDGTVRQYVPGAAYAPAADFQVTRALVDASKPLARHVHVGLTMSHDAFYRQPWGWEQWRERRVLAVEMENATIFTVAALRGLRAGAACLVVDVVGDRESWASDDAIAAATADLVALGLGAARALAEGD